MCIIVIISIKYYFGVIDIMSTGKIVIGGIAITVTG
jgi:hypothetical protein